MAAIMSTTDSNPLVCHWDGPGTPLPAPILQAVGALQPGDMVGLHGPMGAGKTTLTAALGQAFHVPDVIQSPTFALIHEYAMPGGPWPWLHVDLYRLGPDGAPGLFDTLLAYWLSGNWVVWVEWAEFAPSLPWTHRLQLVLDPAHRNRRWLSWEPLHA
jgi:tRNA threonylcarbamoyladenosine biosynthesis protein TsaE